MTELDPHEQWLARLNADIRAKILAMPKEQNFRAMDIACPYQPRVWAMLTTMSQGYDDISTLQEYDGYVTLALSRCSISLVPQREVDCRVN